MILNGAARRLATQSMSKDGVFQFSKLSNKSFVKIWGPDTVKFLNGLLTTKLQPFFLKKNLTTISANDTSQDKSLYFPVDKTNWGVYQEKGPNGAFISRFGQYTTFLNGKGKLLTDSVLYPIPLTHSDTKYPEYLLEFDSNIAEQMLERLAAHRLASRIKLELTPNLNCFDALIQFKAMDPTGSNPWIDNLLDPMSSLKTPVDALLFTQSVVDSLFHQSSRGKIVGMFVDKRFERLVYKYGNAPQVFRIVTTSDVNDLGSIFNTKTFPFEFDIVESSESSGAFKKLRMQNGFIDGMSDVQPETILPLELNFDYIPNVISENKGCYIGQELTARTISTGILRKRAIPVALTEKVDLGKGYLEVDLDEKYDALFKNQNTQQTTSSPFGSATAAKKRKRPVGTLISHEGDLGLVVLRTEYFPLAFEKDSGNNEKFYITHNDKRIGITPIKPLWYDEWKQSQ
ncbi:Iba57p KNAG_0D05210 [Huiozyma naganishii CBS 8797]|uniref:Uncharacterized protein n=1 Tax=Huiozyma naganishii (strain ATCC MYA-139 / BCRC 22969 / CBS 8797 / KCTC 17520 / NBRC 10181 / NCYC 3082 / Yp74L-3) TaxID=1071383 RepID=J7S688_HUIN7|nr:hypothetical protein KNAG_0D05210 [Kazachstania naganishii CBS 8797]CCK70259.1 hypothetical protein KNAG_0D05210 [Kazachstania naganishii CBS 8797]